MKALHISMLAVLLAASGCDVAAMMRARGKAKPPKMDAADALLAKHEASAEGKAPADPEDPLSRLEQRLAKAPDDLPSDEVAGGAGKKAETGQAQESGGGITCPPGSKLYGLPPPRGNNVYCGKTGTLGSTTKHGPYVKWDDRGNKRLEANFYEDQLDGAMETYHPGEQLAELKEYLRGVQSGRWEKYNRNGEKVADGNFLAGKKDGVFRYYDRAGQISAEGPFRNNIRSGTWSYYGRDGALKERVTFRDGKKNGKVEKFAANGRVAATGEYADNKPSGTWIHYYADGHVESRGAFKRGKKDGPWTYFDESGRVKKNVQYVNGMAQRTVEGGAAAQRQAAPQKRGDRSGFVSM